MLSPLVFLQAKEEVKKLIEKAQSNELEAQPGRTIMESFENQVHALDTRTVQPHGCNNYYLVIVSACMLPCLVKRLTLVP
jgi:DNA-directed RNA polymerase beta' subunit